MTGPGAPTPPASIEVFYSYAHEDEELVRELRKHLSILKRQGVIREFYDREITAGTDWEAQIVQHLNSAGVILLLVSADFLASDYCYDHEMTRALARHDQGEARVIPVILRPVNWQRAPFGKLQSLPTDGKPVTSWTNRDEAFDDVARGICNAIGELGAHQIEPPPGQALFFVPFPQNPDFVGRSVDLETLHATLQQREPVGIRPAGLTGMGGIGKTQLAVEYVYRFKDAYPDGIFWINAAEPLARGMAQIGSRLRPQVLERPPDEQLRAAFDELKRRPGALVVFDNLEDPAQLARPVGAEASPLTLGCRILFTTRQRELGRFQPIEVSVLPEEPALQLLLRDDSRHPVRDDPDHPERSEAAAVCRMLGYLPLALELASAFLAEWPEVSLADYRMRLEKEGCLPTLDSEVANLAAVNFQPIHEAAVAATLKTQWEALRPGDETARLVFRVAGQFTEAAAIPVTTLGLFADVSLAGRPGNPSPLERALKRLHDVRLIQELHEKRIRLHPLVREFARSLTPEAETPEFRHACARHVAQALEDFATLENTVQAEGVDLVQQALITALEFAPETQYPARDALASLLRCLAREADHLRNGDRQHEPGYFAQRLLFRATTLGQGELADRAEHRLKTLARPYLALRWRTYRESPALLRVITGHRDGVNSVALSGDGRFIVSGSGDGTVAVWDLQTGERLHELTGHHGGVSSVALSGDGRYIVSASDWMGRWRCGTSRPVHGCTN